MSAAVSRPSPLIALAAFGLLIVALEGGALLGQPRVGDMAVPVCLTAWGIVTLLATWIAGRRDDTAALLLIFGVAIGLRAWAIWIEPISSTDIYRYIWDGRVQAAGINPYRYVPADAALAFLRDAAIYPNINRAEYAPTIYPPVAQFFFFLVTRIGETTTIMRLALVACDGLIIWIVLDLLRQLKQPRALVLAYAWHPMPVWEIAQNGHIDALMLALVMGGLWLLVRARLSTASVAAAAAILVKPYVIILMPIFARGFAWRVPLIAAIIFVACYAPYLSVGSRVFGFFGGYAAEEGLVKGDGFWLVNLAYRAFGEHPAFLYAYIGVALIVMGALALRIVLAGNVGIAATLRDAMLLLLAGLFFISPAYPWYVLLIVPFLAFGTSAAAWVFSIAAFTGYVYWPGDYHMRVLIWKSVLYSAFLAALVYDLTRARRFPFPVFGTVKA